MPPNFFPSRVALAPEREPIADGLADRVLLPGSVVVLTGDAGSGKTTVTDVAVERAQRRAPSLRVLFARGVHPGLPGIYLGLHELLAGIDLAELRLTDAQTVALRTALGLVAPVNGSSPAGAVSGAALAAVNVLLEDGPVAIVVDGLDAVDAESAQVVRYLASRKYPKGRAPSFLITQASERGTIPGAEVLRLRALTRAGVRSVVTDRLRVPISAAAVDRLFTRSRGNPMCAIELARQGAELTASLDELLQERIAGADEGSRRVLQTVAALGEASAAQVMEVLSVEVGAVSTAIDGELIVERDARLSALHPMLGETALAMLGDRERKDLHRRIAPMVDTLTARADHLDRSVDAGPDAGLADLLTEASALALSMGALVEALDLAMRASQRTAPADQRAAAARRLLVAEIGFSCGDYEATIDALGDVSFATFDNGQLDRALPLLGEAAASIRGFAAARAMLRALITPTEDPVRRAIFDTYLAVWDEDRAVSADLARRSVDVLRAAGAAPVSHHRALGVLVLKDVDAGRGLNTELLAQLEGLEPAIQSLAPNLDAMSQRGIYAYQFGDLATSRAALASARAAAFERGDELAAGLFALHLASTELYAGQRSRADQLLTEWEAITPWQNAPPPTAVAAYGLRALRDGDDEELRRIVVSPHGSGSETMGELVRRSLAGWAAARGGRWESAVTDLSAARTLAESVGIHEPGRRFWIDFPLARGLLALGQKAETIQIADVLQTLSDGCRPLLDGVAERLRGLEIAPTDPVGAAQHLRASAQYLRLADFPSEQALTQFELAMAYSDSRERERAVQALDAAVSFARSASDSHLLHMFEAARQIIDRTSVDAGLSARERAVSYAAARGATNREIAAENHLSVRTVESQLSSAYRKLGIRSRSELVALLSAVR